MEGLTIVEHPLVAHRLAGLRDRATPTARFRRLMRELGLLLAAEALRDLPLEPVEIETPIARTRAQRLAEDRLCLVSILRAGEGLLAGALELVPDAPVGHVGLRRDEETLRPRLYYCNLPPGLEARTVLVLDPMLATGGSAAETLDRVKAAGARTIRFVCVVAAPEGVGLLRQRHPDVPLFTAARDERLDDRGFIIPGIGDAGDRLFATR